MRELEQDFVNSWLDYLSRAAKRNSIALTTIQIETGATRIGVPDLYIMIDNGALWLEAKVCTRQRGEEREIKYRAGQQRMLCLMTKKHHICAGTLAIRDDCTCTILAPRPMETLVMKLPSNARWYEFPEALDCVTDYIRSFVNESDTAR